MLPLPPGPLPYDVERVTRWTVGSVCFIGVTIATLFKLFAVARLCGPADTVPVRRLVIAGLAEGGMLIAALYLLQIPVETDARTVVYLLAFFFTGAFLANWLALRKLAPVGAGRKLVRLVLATLIYPVVQTLVAFTLGPVFGRFFIRMFP